MTDKISIETVRKAVQSLTSVQRVPGQPFYGQISLGSLRQWDEDGDLPANLKEVVDGLVQYPDNLVIVVTDKVIDVLCDDEGNFLTFA